jgi:hypothetical protein
MAKKNVSEIEKGAGYFQGLVTGFMEIVREKNVPFEAVYRLVTPEGRKTLSNMVAFAHQDWLAEQPPSPRISADGALPANHYRVPLTYAGMPSFADLKREFGENNVSCIFDGRPFELHPSCAGMSRTPGDRIFFVHNAGREWESEERIAWGLVQRTATAPNGYRPAIHEEEYEFAKAHPELADFIGLGSFALRGDDRCVALVWRDGGRRILGHYWFDFRWPRRCRVLFVRK